MEEDSADGLFEREHLATANQMQPFNEVVRDTMSATTHSEGLLKINSF